MSDKVGEDVLTIAALGRPFHLGMLYDCRSDKILPGITLWDKSNLEEKSFQKHKAADFEIIASDTVDDKSSALDVNIGLKLSFLGGLVEVSGSGKYLDHRKSSNHVERVTLKYKCTTGSEQMTMDQLGKGRIQHPEVFDHGTATHVVTGITYGGHAFFVFDRERSSSLLDHEVSGSLQAYVKAIPGLKIDGKGELEISEDEKKCVNKFSCRYFGDFLPRENPSTFEDAVRLYKDIPNLIGDQGENTVPVTVRLYPLALLDSKACKLVRDISSHLVKETENILEDLYEIDVRCNDLLNSKVAQNFCGIQREIKGFKSLVSSYKLGFQKELSHLLPGIRGGGKQEGELASFLKKKELSPFGHNALNTWLETKESQAKILSEYIFSLSQVKYASKPGDLEALVMSPNHSQVLCFSVLMPVNDTHSEKMRKYISNEELSNYVDVTKKGDQIPLTTVDKESTMMEKARCFRDFFVANKDNSNIAFIIAEESSESSKFQAKVRLYNNGSRSQDDFAIPSAPLALIVENSTVTHDSVLLKWEKPSHGVMNVKNFRISCEDCSGNGFDVTLSTDSNANSFTASGLEPGCEYQISVESVCEVGVSLPCKASEAVKTKPCSPPSKPEVWQISSNAIGVKWPKPSVIGSKCTIIKYAILQQQEGPNWNEIATTASEDLCLSLNVNPNTIYRYKVYCDCGPWGKSKESEVSSDIMAKVTVEELLKAKICEKSDLLEAKDLYIYKPVLKKVASNDQKKIQKLRFGSEVDGIPEKVIMVVGSTGSGKTTLINGIVNYVFGVKWSDSFRFRMITESESHNQAKSQTSKITSYTMHHQEGFTVPYTLTIIDTPGFGDVQGIERDKEITEQIRTFFTAGGLGGIDRLDAVGFVAQSSLPRLTPTQRYIFDQILSLFGKDIAENIFLLLTFADGQLPQVLSGIKEADMPYKKYFKFNNSALYVSNEQQKDEDDSDDDGDFDSMFWKMGEKSFKLFFKELGLTESKSLTLTKDVLNERNQLEVSVCGIKMDIQLGLNKLEQLKKEVEVLTTHQADIDKNKNFTYVVNEEKFEKVPIPAGQYITNCLECNRTCHEVCAIRDDDRKQGCWAITNGYCRICPSKCFWKLHKNFPYKFVCKQIQVTKTAEDLRKRYQEAKEKKLSAEALVLKVMDEFEAVQLKVLGMTETVRKSLQRLKEIALKPNPLSTVEYIDILIQSENGQALPGWQDRVNQLQEVRKQAVYMKQVADKGFDPFSEYKKKIEEEKKQNKKSWWSQAGGYMMNIFK